MKLSDLLQFEPITIQTHDNPDPDALASAYGLYRYFVNSGRSARIIYGGRSPISKANLKLMMKELGIKAEYFTDKQIPVEGLLLTVDCQYGEGNVTPLKADRIAIIDHHQSSGPVKADMDMTEIHSSLGSCSTLVWKLLKDEGVDIAEDRNLSTALYYGLMTDTGNFVEVHHPLDRDMMDELKYDRTMIYQFCNSNISLSELKIAGDALVDYRYNEKHRFAMIASAPCDPNILGLISDLALQVDVVNVCLVYNELGDGYKFSVRSCVKESHADDLAAYIAEGIGSGGGHTDKAGGFISRSKLSRCYEGMTPEEYFEARLLSYFEDILLVHAKEYHIDTSDMKRYTKKPLVIGYVDPMKFLDMGEDVVIRTLEGDFELTMNGDYFVMIGILGEVYSIEKEKFYRTYELVDEEYRIETDYLPTIRRQKDGATIDITRYAGSCRAKGITKVWARPLENPMKIFPVWSEENYMLGHVGDYVACKEDDTQDIYIIESSIFAKTYEEEQ